MTVIAPLSRFSQPIDGTVAAASSEGTFGRSVYELAAGLLGVATGNFTVDTNNGGPIHLRTHATAMHSFSLNQLNTGVAGVAPVGISFGGVGSANNYTVPAGLDLIISNIWCDGAGSTSPVTINSSVQVCRLVKPNSNLHLTFPILLKPGLTINTPAHVGWIGYLVNSDPDIGGIVANITPSAAYTIPNSVNFWMYGFLHLSTANNGKATLLVNSVPVKVATAINNGGTPDNAWNADGSTCGQLSSAPTLFPQTTQLTTYEGGTFGFIWGITM